MAGRLVLYTGDKNASSWSMRGFVALVEKEVPFEERTILFREDKSRSRRYEISPTGKVPVLHHFTGDSPAGAPRVIPDSLAIVEYLEETFPPPAHPALWPVDPAARADARWLAAAMHSGWPRLRESMSFNLCFLHGPKAPTPEALAEAAEILGIWERALTSGRPGGPFLAGLFSAADILFAPVVIRLTAFRVPLARTPHAAAYMAAVRERPSVERWMKEARSLPPQETY